MAYIYKCDRCGQTFERIDTEAEYFVKKLYGPKEINVDLCGNCLNDLERFVNNFHVDNRYVPHGYPTFDTDPSKCRGV